jgi:filamentous hemagglutinin
VNDPVNYIDPFGLTSTDSGNKSPIFTSDMSGQYIGFNGFSVTTPTTNTQQPSSSANKQQGFGNTVSNAVNNALGYMRDVAGWLYENQGAIADILSGALNKIIGRTLDIGAPAFGFLSGVGVIVSTDGVAIVLAPTTAIGVTATAKILGMELTVQGDALLAQGTSNLTPLKPSGGKSTGSNTPVPETTTASNGLKYRSNPKHTPGNQGNNHKSGIEPKNSLDLFENSISDPNGKPNTRWYKDSQGTIHRFKGQNGEYHWNGSTNQGLNSLNPNDIPVELKRMANGAL